MAGEDGKKRADSIQIAIDVLVAGIEDRTADIQRSMLEIAVNLKAVEARQALIRQLMEAKGEQERVESKGRRLG